MNEIKFERKLYNSKRTQLRSTDANPIESKNFLIYQIGNLTYLNGGLIQNHPQLFDFEFSFAEQGKATFFTNNIPELLSVGDIHITLKGDTHRIVANDFFRFSYFAVNVKPTSRLYSLSQEVSKICKTNNFTTIRLPDYFPIVLNILNEIIEPDKYSKIILDNCISQLFIYLYRFFTTPTQTDKTSNFIYSLIIDIDKNCTKYTSIKILAKKYNYTETSLCRIFKLETGKTLKSYLQAKRLNYAKKLLLQKKSVSEVSEILHYSSPYNFSRAYKNHFKISPKQDQKSKKTDVSVKVEIPS